MHRTMGKSGPTPVAPIASSDQVSEDIAFLMSRTSSLMVQGAENTTWRYDAGLLAFSPPGASHLTRQAAEFVPDLARLYLRATWMLPNR